MKTISRDSTGALLTPSPLAPLPEGEGKRNEEENVCFRILSYWRPLPNPLPKGEGTGRFRSLVFSYLRPSPRGALLTPSPLAPLPEGEGKRNEEENVCFRILSY
jgi:hypothetical protein